MQSPRQFHGPGYQRRACATHSDRHFALPLRRRTIPYSLLLYLIRRRRLGGRRKAKAMRSVVKRERETIANLEGH